MRCNAGFNAAKGKDKGKRFFKWHHKYFTITGYWYTSLNRAGE